MDNDGKYLRVLLLAFFLPVLAGMLLIETELETSIRGALVWVAAAVALFVVLRERAEYLQVSPYWAFSAAIPALGVLVGGLLYFKSPTAAAHDPHVH